MFDSPWIVLAAVVAAAFAFRLWLKDYQAQAGGETLTAALPGATPVANWVTLLAVGGVLVLLAIETAGEYALGVVDEQSTMTLALCVYSVLVAPLIEEIIFRGFLYYDKTRATLIASIVGMSLLFAVLHGHIWSYELPEESASWALWEAAWTADYGTKAFFSTGILFVRSLWLYYARFMPANVRRSLIPCVVAHMVGNLGVVIIKAIQGKVELM
ncbi:MAG: CPBP family intramembrane metalloprotease [Planctomycetota bacterium]|nr:MAG: CPBP family intramembrane metalloprotease [Planctomycetota bacterium]REJ92744.1 MAG: CPBP family intramembrane metalloprotease [Planctomycetota bacterium]REK23782.1 MAG: CPBP family intramembrane metalloprotease [Planctomycetota bacterium]REK47635.1 MAG: CPBP family intramembrane metalloprotease [Planctomycetota bacterium]